MDEGSQTGKRVKSPPNFFVGAGNLRCSPARIESLEAGIIPILTLSNPWLPSRACDGHDFPRLIDEGVPSVAAVIDDIVEGFEDPI